MSPFEMMDRMEREFFGGGGFGMSRGGFPGGFMGSFSSGFPHSS